RCRFSVSMPTTPTSRACLVKWPKYSSVATCSNSSASCGRPWCRAWVALQQVHGEGVPLSAHRPEQVLPGLRVQCPYGVLLVSGPTARQGMEDAGVLAAEADELLSVIQA